MNRNIYKMKLQGCKKLGESFYQEARQHVNKWNLESIRNGIKIMGAYLGKECSPIFAQRVCRSYQILQLHSQLWSSHFGSLGKGTQLLTNASSKKWILGFMLYSLCEQKAPTPGIDEAELTE